MFSRNPRVLLAAVASATIMAGSAIALTAPGSWASTFSVSFDAVGTGNTAAWNADHSAAVLHVESGTNPGANARVILSGFAEDSPMPTAQPAFDSSNYGAGNPRLVVETGQSSFFFGLPAKSGCGSACWQQNTGQPESYATAAAAINAQGGVNEVWVVADSGGQGGGLPYTTDITSLAWDGQTLIPGTPPAATVVGPGLISTFVNHSGSCLDNAGRLTPGQGVIIWKCGSSGGAHQQFELSTAPSGRADLRTVLNGAVMCVTPPSGANGQLTIQTCNDSDTQAVAKQGSRYVFTGDGNRVMDLKQSETVNGTPVLAFTANGGKNQEWSLP